ncbi:MAG: GNAT family N-acetyltransferase [Bacteroidota bacterium]
MRNIGMEDLDGMYELDSDPQVHVFLGNNPVKSKEESEQIIQKLMDQYEQHGIGRLAMIQKGSGEFMGWGGLKFEQNLRTEFDYYDLGYRLKPKFWGHGHATASAIASARFGFEVLKLERIGAAAEEQHEASNAILKKIGMVHTEDFFYEETKCNWYWMNREEWLKSNMT